MSLFNPLNHPICLAHPEWLKHSTWTSLVPFGMLLIDLLRPKTIVELGTYYGVSYCAFCQAAKTLNLDVRCYGIDTWQGDSQSGYYGSEVLAELREYHDPLYGDFSSLIQSSFDDALSGFGNGSIDLLHIDGFHSYEAVKHDFESWLPKLSSRAAVIFHDISVRASDFGVWNFWAELKSQYPFFEMAQGYGLGLLGVGREAPDLMMDLLNISDEDLIQFQELFYQLGSRLELTSEVQALRQKTIRQAQFIRQLQDNLRADDQRPITRILRLWLRAGTKGALKGSWLELQQAMHISSRE